MDDIQLNCFLAKISKKVTDYQKYVDREIHEFKEACKKEYDSFLSELNNVLDEAIETQEKILGGEA